MSTTKPRIAISLPPKDYAVIERLAGLQGRPMSRIVAELVAEMAPALSRVVDTLELAQRAQGSVKASIRRAVDDAEATILPHAQAIYEQYEAFGEDLRQLGLQLEDQPKQSGGAVMGRPRRRSAATTDAPEGPRPVITGATKPQRREKTRPAKAARGS